jgi:hypothetical protein
MKPDPVIAEVRAARHKISAEHGHNSRRLIEHYMELQEAARKTGKFRFVTGFYATSSETEAAKQRR